MESPNWLRRASEAWEGLAGLFYPNICQICGGEEAGRKDGYVCARCWAKPDGVRFIVPPYCGVCGLPFEGEIAGAFECGNCREERLYFQTARAAAKYDGVVREVLHRYKYENGEFFEPFLAEVLLRQALPEANRGGHDLIVPIPLHWRRRWQRSFNQAEMLARALSKAAGIPMQRGLLKRVLRTETQTRLSRAARAENVRKAFRYAGKNPLQGEKIILIDDVLTTGATASACSKILMDNGAGRVDVWTVARGMLQ